MYDDTMPSKLVMPPSDVVSSSMKVFLLVLALMSSPPYMCGIPEDADNQQPPTANHENSRPTAKPIAQQQTDERQRENENPNSRIERFLSFSKDNRDVIDVVSAAIVAVFTGVLTLCTVVIWLSEKKRSERELRAYISVTGVIVKALHFNDGYIEAKIDIKNGGQTPAYNIHTRSAVWLDHCPSRSYPAQQWKRTTISLGPGGDSVLKPLSDTRLTKQEINDIQNEKLAIYVAGEIIYTGVFHGWFNIFKRKYITRHRGFWLGYGAEDNDVPVRPSEDGNECS